MVNKKRLSFLASLTNGYDTVLDIGTDHGLVLKEAIDLGYIKKGIAADIGEMPLLQAKKNLVGYPIEFKLSDGFKNIDSSYDAVIIAGMGVYTIIDILEQNHKDATYFLQPNDKYDILRIYLMENGFKIIDEYIVYDKFYYIILKVVKGDMKLSAEDLQMGPFLKGRSEAIPYYKYQVERFNKIIESADLETKQKYETIRSYFLPYI